MQGGGLARLGTTCTGRAERSSVVRTGAVVAVHAVLQRQRQAAADPACLVCQIAPAPAPAAAQAAAGTRSRHWGHPIVWLQLRGACGGPRCRQSKQRHAPLHVRAVLHHCCTLVHWRTQANEHARHAPATHKHARARAVRSRAPSTCPLAPTGPTCTRQWPMWCWGLKTGGGPRCVCAWVAWQVVRAGDAGCVRGMHAPPAAARSPMCCRPSMHAPALLHAPLPRGARRWLRGVACANSHCRVHAYMRVHAWQAPTLRCSAHYTRVGTHAQSVAILP